MTAFESLKGIDKPAQDALVKMMVWVAYADDEEQGTEAIAVVRASSIFDWSTDDPAERVLRWADELHTLNDAQLQEGCHQLAQRLPTHEQRRDAYALCLRVAQADGKVLPTERLLMGWLVEALELSADDCEDAAKLVE